MPFLDSLMRAPSIPIQSTRVHSPITILFSLVRSTSAIFFFFFQMDRGGQQQQGWAKFDLALLLARLGQTQRNPTGLRIGGRSRARQEIMPMRWLAAKDAP